MRKPSLHIVIELPSDCQLANYILATGVSFRSLESVNCERYSLSCTERHKLVAIPYHDPDHHLPHTPKVWNLICDYSLSLSVPVAARSKV